MNQLTQFIKENWAAGLTVFIISIVIQLITEYQHHKKIKKLTNSYKQKLKQKDKLIKSLSESLEERYRFIKKLNDIVDESTSKLEKENKDFERKLLNLQREVCEKQRNIDELRNELYLARKTSFMQKEIYQGQQKEIANYIDTFNQSIKDNYKNNNSNEENDIL